jgi:hypothetical protein
MRSESTRSSRQEVLDSALQETDLLRSPTARLSRSVARVVVPRLRAVGDARPAMIRMSAFGSAIATR